MRWLPVPCRLDNKTFHNKMANDTAPRICKILSVIIIFLICSLIIVCQKRINVNYIVQLRIPPPHRKGCKNLLLHRTNLHITVSLPFSECTSSPHIYLMDLFPSTPNFCARSQGSILSIFDRNYRKRIVFPTMFPCESVIAYISIPIHSTTTLSLNASSIGLWLHPNCCCSGC